MKKVEREFFQNTRWFHATPSKYLDSLKKGVSATINKGSSLDFGYGFYLSPDKEWSIRYINRIISEIYGNVENDDCGIIIQYDFSPLEYIKQGASYIFFDKKNEKYADFVINNRIHYDTYDYSYDFVAGLMLTDYQIMIIQKYKENMITKDALTNEILKESNDWQLLLHTQSICNKLKPSKFYNMRGDEIYVPDDIGY